MQMHRFHLHQVGVSSMLLKVKCEGEEEDKCLHSTESCCWLFLQPHRQPVSCCIPEDEQVARKLMLKLDLESAKQLCFVFLLIFPLSI